MAALSASGVPASQFVFLGFPPRAGKARVDWFNDLSQEPRTTVFFEAPHRITKTIEQVRTSLVDRPIYIHRELTKLNEEYIERPNINHVENIKELGEFVVVVGRPIAKENSVAQADEATAKAIAIVDCLTEKDSFSQSDAEAIASSALSLDPRSVRKAHKKHRIAIKQRS
jgi:16S rRNA (cytidine1402-2'-O)-methyltransferase